MSETTARPSAEGARSGSAPAGPGPGSGWLAPANAANAAIAAIALMTLLALALRVYRVTRPGLFSVTQYDDGPYFGSAVRLIHAAVPYRDYSFVQPPGITVLMSPVALLSTVTGTAQAMAAARLLTAVAGAAGVVLVGLLTRHRGLLAVLVSCGLLAVFPPSVAAAHTVMLEPWLVLFALAGAVAVFDGDQLTASARRLAWGGAALGFAGAVKTWAIVPVVVIFALSLPRLRTAMIFAGGVAAGFLLTVAPFAALSPTKFYDNIIAAQLGRNSAPVAIGIRLQDMLGIIARPPVGKAVAPAALAAIAAFAAAAYVAPAISARRLPPALDRFAAATTVLVIVMFLLPPYFSAHYTAFLEPFLAVATALPLARLAAAGRRAGLSPARRRLPRSLAALFASALAVVAVVQVAHPGNSPTGGFSVTGLRRAVPPGACVLSDQVSYLLLADRFVSGVPGCPQMVDGLGTDLALAHGLGPTTGAGKVPAVVAAWENAFSHAQYVVLSSKNALRIPWTPTLRAYFGSRFARVMRRSDFSVYARSGAPQAG